MAKIDDLKKGIDELKEELLVKEPSHFSERDLVSAFFGALLLGLTFAMKGLLIEVSQALTNWNIVFILLFTFIILTAEIYGIGYARVRKKNERKFGQFWLKRIIVFYLVALFVSILLVFVFGLNRLTSLNGDYSNIVRLIVLISMPCAIGAATADLVKKY